MPIVDTVNGIVIPRRIGGPLADAVSAARAEFGFGVTNPANSIREIVEAVGVLPWDTREQDIVNLSLQMDPRINSGQFLEAGLWPLFRRLQPTVAAGNVNLNYNQIVTSPTPLFAAGDLEFRDGAGKRFTGTDDINPPAAIHDTSGQTGTLSETIGSANTRIAQKVTITDTEFPQAIRLGLASVLTGTPLIEAHIETDSAGNPSGVLANSRLTFAAVPVVNAGNTDIIIPQGAVLATGDYWIVLIVTGGTAKFDGGTGGVANQVKFYNGAWATAATVENLHLILYNGGQFPVVAADLGIAGNIAVDSIGSVHANNGSAETRFNTIVDSFENLEAFQGGRSLESDNFMRARAISSAAARGTTSPGGLVVGMLDGHVDGVTFVDIIENDSLDWGQQETVLNNSTKTGTNSDLIDGVTYTKIAQRFTVTDHASVAAIAVKLAATASGVFTLGVYPDAAGSPGSTLVSAKLEKTGITPGDTARHIYTLTSGDFLEAGVYWLVATRTAGTFRFDGSNAGATDNVKRYTGAAWQLSTVIEDMNVEIYGGVPPKSFELFVEGGSDNDVAQGIYGLKAPGITAYGPETGTALDVASRNVTVHFARPINVDFVVDVQVEVTPEFAGNADDIRDLISEYVDELGIGEAVVRQEAMGRLITGDSRTTGVNDLLKFRLGVKSTFATPGALTGTEIINLTTTFGHRFRIFDPAADIQVTLTPVV